MGVVVFSIARCACQATSGPFHSSPSAVRAQFINHQCGGRAWRRCRLFDSPSAIEVVSQKQTLRALKMGRPMLAC